MAFGDVVGALATGSNHELSKLIERRVSHVLTCITLCRRTFKRCKDHIGFLILNVNRVFINVTMFRVETTGKVPVSKCR